jgi:cytochrome c5
VPHFSGVFVNGIMPYFAGHRREQIEQNSVFIFLERKKMKKLFITISAFGLIGLSANIQAADGQKTYQAACFACHGAGVAGAPKTGDKAAWKDRIAQGNDTLYKHAIKGYTGKKGVMPAKGGRADLSDDAVKAAVDYMVAESK